MPRRYLVVLLVLLQVIGLLPTAASAAEPTVKSQIRLVALSYPKFIKAGTTATFRAEVDASAESGLSCCGTLDLRGPGGQVLRIRLARVGDTTLEGSIFLDPHSAPGAWTVRRMYIQANSWAELELVAGESFNHGFTVTASGKVLDTRGPEMLSLSLPEAAKIGEGFPITITAKDDLSGIDRAYVVIKPDRASGGTWWEQVHLEPTGKAGEWSGNMLMEPGAVSSYNLAVTEVVLYDKAGNYTWLKAQDLESRKVRTTVRPESLPVPKALLPSPFLDLIHPGLLLYDNWHLMDREYLLDLLARVPAESTAVREHLVAEITQIRVALDRIKGEVYTDPTTGLRVSPYATTGKWLVLERAILLRTFLLTLTHEPAQAVTELVRASYESYLKAWHAEVADGAKLLKLDGGNNLRYGRTAVAYLNLISRSPEAVAALKLRGDQAFERTRLTEMEPNVIYFMPVRADRPFYWQPGTGSLRIPALRETPMQSAVRGLFYQVGLHLGEALFSSSYKEHRSQSWSPYIALRQGHDWPDGNAGGETPATNLAVDFADQYLPSGIRFRMAQSYLPLGDHPEMQTAFRKMVEERLQSPQPPLSFSAKGSFQVSLEEKWMLTVRSPGARAGMLLAGETYANAAKPFTQENILPVIDRQSLVLISSHLKLGRSLLYNTVAVDATGRDHYRSFAQMWAPLLLDPIPAGTNKTSVELTGTTLPGKRVSVGTKSATADDRGRFSLVVPVRPGENLLRLTVGGTNLGARVVVHASPAEATIPLTMTKTPPTKTKEAYAYMEGKTAPYAVIRTRTIEIQAGGDGRFWASLYLPARLNTLELVSTDRFGNQVTWTQEVARDKGPISLTVQVTPRSATARLYSLIAEPGVTITVNGESLNVGKDGTAHYTAILAEGESSRELLFVAEDPFGNRTAKRFTFSREEE
ncbi:MAG: hypothetical protein ACOY94_27650 [Bacillota bacterium]